MKNAKKSILVVAAHPDDEVLGCGGTLAKYANDGAIIHVAFLADGVFSRDDSKKDLLKKLTIRQTAAKKACEILGVKSVSFNDFPDNKMDTIPLLDVAKIVEDLVTKHQPEIIFTHHPGDVNVDHQIVNQSVITACRPKPGHPVRTILNFEVLSSTEWQFSPNEIHFQPNWFEDISGTLKLKIKAMEVYVDELCDWPHPRSLEAIEYLSRWRGLTVGVKAAEAFVLARKIK
tara:strand:- start:3953 stop:4645 length:693 start_codon:yes stop_codon:yes gene_type:complete